MAMIYKPKPDSERLKKLNPINQGDEMLDLPN
jgi:hypothetical protein